MTQPHEKTAAILAGGEGSRLKSYATSKPFASVGGRTLVERVVDSFGRHGMDRILCALNAEFADQNWSAPRTEVFYIRTPSSMHTLWEVVQRLRKADWSGSHLWVSMVDTVLPDSDFRLFVEAGSSLAREESLVVVTPYIDDEKPLLVRTDSAGRVTSFGKGGRVATSGLYCFSREVFSLLEREIESGQMKMRNFLAALVEANYGVRALEVEKSFDVDRPEDVARAEAFLS